MTENTKSNIEQIKALRNSKIKSAQVKELIEKRVNQARKEIAGLRNFANKKPGSKPAMICNAIADEIEKYLKQ